MTPEGRVKAKITRLICQYPDTYKFMSVPSGWGPSTLDYVLCVNGKFLAIEAKVPGKKPTPRQQKIIADIERAGGVALTVDGSEETMQQLKTTLDKFSASATTVSTHPGALID